MDVRLETLIKQEERSDDQLLHFIERKGLLHGFKKKQFELSAIDELVKLELILCVPESKIIE